MAVSFDLRERLGSGYFGEVWLAMDTGLGVERAVKLIPKEKLPDPNNLFHESQILRAAEHLNVVRVEDTGTMGDGRVYVAMEYLPKGSLEDEAKGRYIDLTRTKRIMIDVFRGLEHAHRQGILHRDIKPANILVGNNMEGKLSDFGLAIPQGAKNTAGLTEYLYTLHTPPEVLDGKEYTELSEIYSCGVTLYRLVNGDSYLPGWSSDFTDKITSGEFPDRSSYRAFVPRAVRSVINKCLKIEPHKRFRSVEELRHAVEQLTIIMNWNESQVSNGTQWICGHEKKTYEVGCTKEPNGKWQVVVRKGKRRADLRKDHVLSADNLNKTQAERVASRVLQDYVLGKKR